MKKFGIGALVVGIIIVMLGAAMKIHERSVSVIGGADGPTVIYVAGNVGSGLGILGIIFGVILLGLGIFMILRKK